MWLVRSTEVGVGHQGGWLEDTGDSVSSRSVIASLYSSGSLDFDIDIGVGAFCTADYDSPLVSDALDSDGSFVTESKIDLLEALVGATDVSAPFDLNGQISGEEQRCTDVADSPVDGQFSDAKVPLEMRVHSSVVFVSLGCCRRRYVHAL
jgi:hypothetical protein